MFGNSFEDRLLHFLAIVGCASTSQLMRLHPELAYKANHQKIARMEAKQMLQRIGRIALPSGGRCLIWALTPAYARLLSAPEYFKTGRVFLEKGLLKAEYVLSSQEQGYPYLFKDKKALFEHYATWPFPSRGAIPLGTDALVYEGGGNVVCCFPIVDIRSLGILSAEILSVFQENIHLKLLSHNVHKLQLENHVQKITSVENDNLSQSLPDWKRYFNSLPSEHPMRRKVQNLISHMVDHSIEFASLSDMASPFNVEVISCVIGAVFHEEVMS